MIRAGLVSAFMMLLLSSCETLFYVPQPIANPMFHEKGQVSAQAGMTNRHIQATAAWSPVKHLALIGTFSKTSAIGEANRYIDTEEAWGMGGRVQYYGTFRKGGYLFYHLNAGMENGRLLRTWENSGGFPHDSRYAYTANVRYNAYAIGGGLYWRHGERVVWGIDLDYTNYVYSRFDYHRFLISGPGQGSSEHTLYTAGTRPARGLANGALSLKISDRSQRFYVKTSTGFCWPYSDFLELKNPAANTISKIGYMYLDTEFLLFSLQIGFELEGLFKSR